MPRQSRIGILLLATAVFLVFYLKRDNNLNEPAPDFSLVTHLGARVGLESYRGRPLLLVFWTTSCGICQHELPLLNRMAAEFRNKGIAVVAIHLGGEEEARGYMQANGINLELLADPEGVAARAYHVGGVPKLILIGGDGKIKRSVSGWTDRSVLRDWIDSVGGS
jgi:cytochrome c biogenesis protein CcmG/thiol:disulfide interchange protein DsbE